MHELVVVKDTLQSVLKYAEDNGAEKVVSVYLRIGILRDFIDAWVKRYFAYASKGTIAEGAVLEIERVKASSICDKCGKTASVERKNIHNFQCPYCGNPGMNLLYGMEYQIVHIGIQKPTG